MNVVFLDYDGVVNTPMWDSEGKHCRFNFPEDNKVNNFQAVQWVSEFCQKYDYSIVVTSSWRLDENYKTCLINGGLRKGIEILGRTPSVLNGNRGDEIQKYLNEHPDVENFVIFDDEDDVGILRDYLVKCETNFGFGEKELRRAEGIHQRQENKKHVISNVMQKDDLSEKYLDGDEFLNIVDLGRQGNGFVEKCTREEVSITLLSLEEYISYKKIIPMVNDWWWLRSPGYESTRACNVQEYGCIGDYGEYVYACCGIRPAFRINNHKYEIGSKAYVGSLLCTVIDYGYALSDSIIMDRQFDKKSNDWDTSELKSFIESNEFAESIGL